MRENDIRIKKMSTKDYISLKLQVCDALFSVDKNTGIEYHNCAIDEIVKKVVFVENFCEYKFKSDNIFDKYDELIDNKWYEGAYGLYEDFNYEVDELIKSKKERIQNSLTFGGQIQKLCNLLPTELKDAISKIKDKYNSLSDKEKEIMFQNVKNKFNQD